MLKVLHVAAEVWPLIKTGGLADVVAALPAAQQAQGAEARLLLPGFPAVVQAMPRARTVAEFGPCFGAARVRLRLGRLPGSGLRAYVLQVPMLYEREGGPYHDAAGRDWPDNLQRFGLLGWVGAQLAAGALDEDWQPAVLHAHDWHAAMACAYLRAHGAAISSVFTVHNLAYQGLFPLHDHGLLGLSSDFANSAGLEYHGRLSFMKAGLKFAQRITTVSPTYAAEIATHEFGCGLEGVIRARGAQVRGILNGIDEKVWDPAADAGIAAPFGLQAPQGLAGKARCKAALQGEAGLAQDAQAPLFVVLSRLTAQKGVDLLLGALPALLQSGAQLVVQGSGDASLAQSLREAAARHPTRMAAFIGYDEARAHRLVAGADMMLVPSRFEPCGLTQMYALRYGTLPVVRRTGGLADTVIDPDAAGDEGRANGFVFDAATPEDLLAASRRAIEAWRDPAQRHSLQRAGMSADLSWRRPAQAYLDLYREICDSQVLPAAS